MNKFLPIHNFEGLYSIRNANISMGLDKRSNNIVYHCKNGNLIKVIYGVLRKG